MNIGERAFELAAEIVDKERDSIVAGIQAELSEPGRAFCIGCGDLIEAARQRALPSARRCITCQGQHEREVR